MSKVFHGKRIAGILGLLLGGMLSACSSPAVILSPRLGATAKIAKAQTVVFIHGMFMTPACWEKWEPHFQARGYKTLVPAWPEHELPIVEQRKASAKLAAVTLEEVLERYRKAIRELGPENPPILVGHSMGGLIVQLLLQEGLGAAGIAIDSAPPKGVISLKYSFLKSNWPVVSPSAKLDNPIVLSQDDWNYAFTNCVASDEQKASFEKYAVPESRRVGKGPTTDAAKIQYDRARPPLLMIAGELDHIIPASLNRSNYGKYASSPSITDFREFPGRCHYIIGQQGWEEVADYALDWIKNNQQ